MSGHNEREPQGLSDQQKAAELKAQGLVLPLVAQLKSALQDAMLLSDLMRDRLHDLAAVLDDYAPSPEFWVEAVQDADNAGRTGRYRRAA